MCFILYKSRNINSTKRFEHKEYSSGEKCKFRCKCYCLLRHTFVFYITHFSHKHRKIMYIVNTIHFREKLLGTKYKNIRNATFQWVVELCTLNSSKVIAHNRPRTGRVQPEFGAKLAHNGQNSGFFQKNIVCDPYYFWILWGVTI